MNWQIKETYKNLDLKQFQALALKLRNDFGLRAVVALKGPMSAGKTEFVKALVSEATSPTFAIHQSYPAPEESANVDLSNLASTPRLKVAVEHLDLFRLENEDDLESTGFWDLFALNSGLIFIEWPEKMDLAQIPDRWPLWKIEISKDTEDTRSVVVSLRT